MERVSITDRESKPTHKAATIPSPLTYKKI